MIIAKSLRSNARPGLAEMLAESGAAEHQGLPQSAQRRGFEPVGIKSGWHHFIKPLVSFLKAGSFCNLRHGKGAFTGGTPPGRKVSGWFFLRGIFSFFSVRDRGPPMGAREKKPNPPHCHNHDPQSAPYNPHKP